MYLHSVALLEAPGVASPSKTLQLTRALPRLAGQAGAVLQSNEAKEEALPAVLHPPCRVCSFLCRIRLGSR
jgi:hypothetical protein